MGFIFESLHFILREEEESLGFVKGAWQSGMAWGEESLGFVKGRGTQEWRGEEEESLGFVKGAWPVVR